jgi:hypothetical protein
MALVMGIEMTVILALKLGTIPMGKLDLRARLERQVVYKIHNSMAALTLMVDLGLFNKTQTTV